MLWENENLTDVAEYGPSLPCSARSLEHFLITATGVSVEWSNKPLPMYTLGSCCVQVGFGGFHRLCLTWSHFYFLKFVRGNETMHCSNCSQVMQVPEPPIPAGCILAFSYCRTGSEISWHSLVCSWVTFLFPSPFSWQWVLGQCSQISHLLFVNGRNIPTQVCLTEGQISWQLNFWTKIGEHLSLLHSWYVYFFPCLSRTRSVWNPICLSQSQSYHKTAPFIPAGRQGYIRQGEIAAACALLPRGHVPDGHVVWLASLHSLPCGSILFSWAREQNCRLCPC